MSDDTIHHFSMSNPSGDGQGSVPAPLRRLGDAIDGEGDVAVQDVTVQSEVTDGEDDLTMTVYFRRQPRRWWWPGGARPHVPLDARLARAPW